ncbi:MAG: NUDIX domain-containing protein [Candidatus Eisenbacteria bacterium]|nr:NUDIX domain-containing protein [Candidatus Eisenbacteria bacterium]
MPTQRASVMLAGMPPRDFTSTVQSLKSALSGRLPGSDQQAVMAPRPRPGWEPDFGRVADRARHAAVLLLLYPREGRPYLPLTLRTGTLESHRGQVSFPGGALEPGETDTAAAVREAEEEIHIDPARVAVLGKLTPLHVPVSGYLVHPIAAVTSTTPDFVANPIEVEEIYEVSLERLLAAGAVTWCRERHGGREYCVPYFRVGALMVWGATAMMLAEFLHLLGWAGAPEPPAALSDGTGRDEP